jgi:putative two-component system response regulator
MSTDQLATILVVDDEDFLRRMVVRKLHAHGYHCTSVESGTAALAALAQQRFDLVVTDLMMPGMSGLEVLVAAKHVQPDIAVIVLTGVDSAETAIAALTQGAYGYMIKPFQPNELLINVVNALRRRELEMQHVTYEQQLESEVYARTQEITLRLVSASEYRDEDTGAHIRRIAQYAMVLAREVGWSTEQIDLLRLAAPMHDIGKIGIPDSILRKPGKLDPEEFAHMKQHTLIGTQMLKDSECPLVQLASVVAFCHHERWDGSGYPQGLSGDAIPESARIVALADVYDALHTDRVYRPAFSEREALTVLTASQAQFDPQLFACMIEHLDEFRHIRQTFADTTT